MNIKLENQMRALFCCFKDEMRKIKLENLEQNWNGSKGE